MASKALSLTPLNYCWKGSKIKVDTRDALIRRIRSMQPLLQKKNMKQLGEQQVLLVYKAEDV